MNDIFEDLMEQWFSPGFAPKVKRDNAVVKPDLLFRYEGGYGIGRRQTPRRVAPVATPRAIEHRGAHP